MTEELEKAQREFEAASKALHAQLVGKPGNANETRYGEAYKRLVVAGGATPLKRKYSQAKKYR